MKLRLTKRLLSLLLCLCMVLTLFAGLTVVYASPTRNGGERDELCISLSQDAIDYYTGSYSYSLLKALPGATSTADSLQAATGNTLYSTLHTLMETTFTHSVSYISHSTWYAYTDCEKGDTSGRMRLFWASAYIPWSGARVNREHVWCKSHATYVENRGGADLHHLRPASAEINQHPHNNKPYGSAQANGGTATTDEYGNPGGWYLNVTEGYPAGLYEPPDNAKGDCARILLYVYTMWKQPNLYTSQDTTSAAYNNFIEDTAEGTCDGIAVIESLNTLLQWCEEDPVDTWEMGRNDAAQSIQGNRNVFIDYPELAWYMFGLTPPSDMITPSGDAITDGSPYRITDVTVNDTIYGTATIDNDYMVSVALQPGCYIASATSTSGTPNIADNKVIVSGMTANATLSLTLAQYPSAVISFSVPAGVTQNPINGYENCTVTLPTPTGTTTADVYAYTFAGWVSGGAVNDTLTEPTFYLPGDSYPVTCSETLYALYTYEEYVGGGGPTLTQMGSGDILEDGDRLIIVAHGRTEALYQQTVEGSYVECYDFSTYNLDPSLLEADALNYLTVEEDDESIYLGDITNGYLNNGSSNNLYVNNTTGIWELEDLEDGTFKLRTNNRYLSYRYELQPEHQKWKLGGANLANSGQTVLDLYKLGVDTGYRTYYTTELQWTVAPCDHTNHSVQGYVAEGCLTDGYSGDDVCDDCGTVLQQGTVIPAYGSHDWDSGTVTVAATCSAQGEIRYTCSRCGDTDNVQTPMLAHTEDNGTVTTQPTCLLDGVRTYACTVCGTVARTVAEPAMGHDISGAVTTSPTCDTPGVMTYQCSRCSYSYTEAIPALGGTHNYDAGTVTVQPTCVTEGQLTQTCTVCGNVAVTSLGYGSHDYLVSTTQLPTCGTPGTQLHICQYCNDQYTTAISPTGNHTYNANDDVVITQPTCTVPGELRRTCTVCGTSLFVTINALGHIPAHCVTNNDRTHTGRCTRCGLAVTEECTFAATLVGSITTRYTCTKCGYTYLKMNREWYINVSDAYARCDYLCTATTALAFPSRRGITLETGSYNFVGWVDVPVEETTVKPSVIRLPGDIYCPDEETGTDFYALYSTCAGGEYSRIASTSDLFAGDSFVITAQDDTQGLGIAVTGGLGCVSVGGTAAPNYQNAAAFSFETGETRGEWYLRVGEQYLAVSADYRLVLVNEKNTDCSRIWKIESIDKEGNAVISVRKANGEKGGYLSYKDKSFAVTTAPASSVALYKKSGTVTYTTFTKQDTAGINSAYLTLNDNIDVTYTVDLPKEFDEAYMVFTMNGAATKVDDYTEQNGGYAFTFEGVLPQQMGDNISAELVCVADGKTYTDTVAEYSVRQYCINQLGNKPNEKLTTLLSDLLTYGAAAQTYAGYQTDALVTDGLELTPSKYEAITPAKAAFSGEQSPEVDWKAATLTLRNAVTVRLYFTAEAIDGLTVTAALGETERTFGAADFATNGNGLYYVDFRGIAASQFDEPVTAGFVRNGAPIGRTISYAVNNYISVMQDVENTKLQTLVRTLYNYGAAAESYLAK